MCERWRSSFEAFYADMGPRPSPAHSIDRINNDGNYEPGNCRWATHAEQGANRIKGLLAAVDMTVPLSAAQASWRDSFARFQRERGYRPSLRELAALHGATSTNGAKEMLDRLIRSGAVRPRVATEVTDIDLSLALRIGALSDDRRALLQARLVELETT